MTYTQIQYIWLAEAYSGYIIQATSCDTHTHIYIPYEYAIYAVYIYIWLTEAYSGRRYIHTYPHTYIHTYIHIYIYIYIYIYYIHIILYISG